jgi:hypothetical protein
LSLPDRCAKLTPTSAAPREANFAGAASRRHRRRTITPGVEGTRGEATFYEVKTDAVALLRAMKEYHERHDPGAPFSAGTRLAPYLAAERAGLDPDTLRYERAVRYLVREGVLVWEERVGTVPGIDFYRFTGSGLELLRGA